MQYTRPTHITQIEGIDLYVADLQSLQPGVWVTDAVVDTAMRNYYVHSCYSYKNKIER